MGAREGNLSAGHGECVAATTYADKIPSASQEFTGGRTHDLDDQTGAVIAAFDEAVDGAADDSIGIVEGVDTRERPVDDGAGRPIIGP